MKNPGSRRLCGTRGSWQKWDKFWTSVNKYQWVLALSWFIILLVLSSDCKAWENQPGVEQVPGQCGSEYKPVIFCDIFYKYLLEK